MRASPGRIGVAEDRDWRGKGRANQTVSVTMVADCRWQKQSTDRGIVQPDFALDGFAQGRVRRSTDVLEGFATLLADRHHPSLRRRRVNFIRNAIPGSIDVRTSCTTLIHRRNRPKRRKSVKTRRTLVKTLATHPNQLSQRSLGCSRMGHRLRMLLSYVLSITFDRSIRYLGQPTLPLCLRSLEPPGGLH